MADSNKTCLINVYAGMNDKGVVYEELPARKLADNLYELLSSPGLALNMARGDIISIPDESLPPDVVKRGGNFCIQIYADDMPDGVIAELEESVRRELGGTLDGVCEGNLSLSVPAASVNKIQDFFDKFTIESGIQWYYGNVYKNFQDPNDETLLDWWLS